MVPGVGDRINGDNMSNATVKFVVGEEYFYRFICDSDTSSYMTIVSRTDKTAVISERGKHSRRKIHVRDGIESISAGNYSMAGSWYANRPTTSDDSREPDTVAPSNVVAFPSKPVAAPVSVDPAEARIMEAMGRKILMEALEAQGRKDEAAMIASILDRDHVQFLALLQELAQGIRSGTR